MTRGPMTRPPAPCPRRFRYHRTMRYLLGLVLVAALIAGGLFMYAGHLPGPAIEIVKPVKYVGQTTTVEVAVTAPGARLTNLQTSFEHTAKQPPLASPPPPA